MNLVEETPSNSARGGGGGGGGAGGGGGGGRGGGGGGAGWGSRWAIWHELRDGSIAAAHEQPG